MTDEQRQRLEELQDKGLFSLTDQEIDEYGFLSSLLPVKEIKRENSLPEITAEELKKIVSLIKIMPKCGYMLRKHIKSH